MNNKIAITLFLLAGFIVSVLSLNAMGAGTVKTAGTLTAVEDDEHVVIDDKGYLLDSSARIVDPQGRRISLRNLSFPVKVKFEYEYAKRGFVITAIEIIPQ